MVSPVNKHWFFDLEATVIDSWTSALLVRTTQVRDFLRRHNVTAIHIFSFAVWNERDQATFERELKPVLERALEVQVLTCPCLEDFRAATLDQTGLEFSSDDYCQKWGKVRAFLDYVRQHNYDGHAVLVDDLVPTVATVERLSGHVVECVNVWQLDQWRPLVVGDAAVLAC